MQRTVLGVSFLEDLGVRSAEGEVLPPVWREQTVFRCRKWCVSTVHSSVAPAAAGAPTLTAVRSHWRLKPQLALSLGASDNRKFVIGVKSVSRERILLSACRWSRFWNQHCCAIQNNRVCFGMLRYETSGITYTLMLALSRPNEGGLRWLI